MQLKSFLVPALLLSLAACAGDDTDETDVDTDTDTDTDTAAEETARIRLTHTGVFPQGVDSAVDIFVNGENSGITFSFGDATDYVELPVGTYDFAVVPSGGEIGDAAVTVEDFELTADQSWSFVASGYVAPENGQPGLSVGAFEEDYSDLAATDTRLNVVHSAALPAFDPVDVWVVDGDCAPVGDAPLLAGFEFGQVASGVDVPSGALGVGLDVGADATVDACFQVPELGGGVVANVYAVNDLAGSPFLLAQLPDGASAQVDPEELPQPTGQLRLGHFGVFPDGLSSDVDIWVNGENSGITFGFKDVTDYVELPAGTYDFDIVPAGQPLSASAATVTGFELGEDESWAIFANGYVAPTGDQPGLGVGAYLEDNAGIPGDSYRLNVVHAAALPALDPVDVWVVDDSCAPVGDGPLLDDFAFTQVQTNVDLPGAVNVGFDIGGDATVDACFKVPDLGDGTVANVFAVNDLVGNVSLVAQLPEGADAEITPEP